MRKDERKGKEKERAHGELDGSDETEEQKKYDSVHLPTFQPKKTKRDEKAVKLLALSNITPSETMSILRSCSRYS